MTPTVEYVQQKIREFNDLIFSSSLPPIPVRLSKARSFLGKIQYRTRRLPIVRSVRNTGFVMRISVMFDLPEREQEDVIIHEMIHYYLAYNGIKDTSMHGKIFREHMERINREFGRNVSVRHRSSLEAVPNSQEVRAHYICVSLLPNGERGITVCAKTRVFELYRSLPRRYSIIRMSWYGSMDPFFNRFPRARTPKIYRIPPRELEEHLKTAREMVCDGRTLKCSHM